MAEQFVIVEHSSSGDRLAGAEPYWTEAEALGKAQLWSRDASTSDTPITHSVHRLSEALWEG